MTRINCSIISDLMPLYVDGAVSPETAAAVKEHLESCQHCQSEYKSASADLTLPVSRSLEGESVHTLKAFKRKWKRKKIAIACVSAFLTMVLLFCFLAAYRNIGAVHDLFSPSIRITLRDISPSNEWQKIKFAESEFLEFDSVFFSKEVVNDGNSSGTVFLRISDVSGNIILNETEILPGTSLSLDMLRNNTPYSVEIKSDADFLHLNFC